MGDTAPMKVVVCGNCCIGFITTCGARGYKGYDTDGRPLGLFQDERDAAKAVYASATSS